MSTSIFSALTSSVGKFALSVGSFCKLWGEKFVKQQTNELQFINPQVWEEKLYNTQRGTMYTGKQLYHFSTSFRRSAGKLSGNRGGA